MAFENYSKEMLNFFEFVGENTHLLPHMLNHYKDMVDKIYVAVYKQSNDDSILEQIEELGIEPYMVFTEEKYNWNRVTEIYNAVKGTRPNDWWIVSDDDELQLTWKQAYSLEEYTADGQFKGYEELDSRLNAVLNVAPRVAAVQQEEEETPAPTGGFNDTDITPSNKPEWAQEISDFRQKAVASSPVEDEDDALSYFAKLAEEDL